MTQISTLILICDLQDIKFWTSNDSVIYVRKIGNIFSDKYKMVGINKSGGEIRMTRCIEQMKVMTKLRRKWTARVKKWVSSGGKWADGSWWYSWGEIKNEF